MRCAARCAPCGATTANRPGSEGAAEQPAGPVQRGAHATAWHARQSNRHSSLPLRRLAMVEDLDDCIYPPYGHGVGLVLDRLAAEMPAPW